MSCFQNILVGIDLTQCTRLALDALPPITQDVFRRSVWLAQKTAGRLTFLSALNLADEALLMLEEKHRLVAVRRIEEEARQVLAGLVQKAQEDGVPAASVFTHGRGWLELIRQVLRGNHDLVLAGTRNLPGTRRMLFGSTAMKLIRHCPCPVWVRRPGPPDRPLNVLVASDLRPASEEALRLAVCLGEALDATLHVLHVLEYPLYHLWLTGLPDEVGSEYHRQAHARAQQVLREQLERTTYQALSRPVQVHLADRPGRPDEAILTCIQEHAIDLLIMGTVGRGGLPGALIGNTAERVLPEVPCSLLAVKPPDFQCPVQPA
jgi:universal stress protein E